MTEGARNKLSIERERHAGREQRWYTANIFGHGAVLAWLSTVAVAAELDYMDTVEPCT